MTSGAIAWQVASWPARRWLVVAAATVLAAVFLGVPTDLLPTPLFRRMSPIPWWDYPIWVASAALAGLIAATYDGSSGVVSGREKAEVGGGLLSYLAVGCPSCNKLAVLALGAGGTSSYFAPVQPFLGLLGLGVLAATLTWRLCGLASCRVKP